MTRLDRALADRESVVLLKLAARLCERLIRGEVDNGALQRPRTSERAHLRPEHKRTHPLRPEPILRLPNLYFAEFRVPALPLSNRSPRRRSERCGNASRSPSPSSRTTSMYGRTRSANGTGWTVAQTAQPGEGEGPAGDRLNFLKTNQRRDLRWRVGHQFIGAKVQQVEALGERIAAETGKPFNPLAPGEYVTGSYRQRLALASGRFAMIDDGSASSWCPGLRHVSGLARDDGGVDWGFGWGRGLGL